jgi:lysophospholipase L1-like esterase
MSSRSGRMHRALKTVVFSLLPTVAVLLAAEGAIRLFSLDRPFILGGGYANFGPESGGRIDAELGWSPKPNNRVVLPSGLSFTTNSLGLRSPELPVVKGNEFRILSLGESSAFGIGVSDDQTYAARLESQLNASPGRLQPVRVLNAAVSDYSSTQSLRYLELRGLALQPDLILFYHELNDYLPSTMRDIEIEGLDLLRTDRQLLDSKLGFLNRRLLQHFALYRFVSERYVGFRLRRYIDEKGPVGQTAGTAGGGVSAFKEIGLPMMMSHAMSGSPTEVEPDGRRRRLKGYHPELLGRRVSEKERRENLERLAQICEERGIRLVIVHPAYKLSVRHDCLLTRFCRERRIPMLEAFDSLHPGGDSPANNPLFADLMHPSAAGHERLAEDLSRIILRTYGRI